MRKPPFGFRSHLCGSTPLLQVLPARLIENDFLYIFTPTLEKNESYHYNIR
jgi:hypothetical protein